MITTAKPLEQNMNKHTLSVVVYHNMNTFSRIIGIFSGQGYEIDSLSFGTVKEDGKAQITITTYGDSQTIEQIIKQLHNVVDVKKVTDLTNEQFVDRELALVKINADVDSRAEVMQITQVFKAKVIDISPQKLSVEVTGNSDKIDAFIGMVRPFGVTEVARTGTTAVKREYSGTI